MDDELISREAVRQIYREEVCRVKDIHDLEPFINRIERLPAVEQEPKSPCDLCRFNPPSSSDGKPCTMCPAQATERFKDKLERGYFRERKEI